MGWAYLFFFKQGDEVGGGTSSDDTDIDAVITEYRKSVPVSVATVSGTREGQPGRAQQVQKSFYTPSPSAMEVTNSGVLLQ